MIRKQKLKILLTGLVVLIAIGVLTVKYWHYITNPWTRNGQVRAQVVQITPRVSGPIIKLPISDDQFVKAGDILFQIDPRTFVTTLKQAQAELDKTFDEIEVLKKQLEVSLATKEMRDTAVNLSFFEIKETEARMIETKAQLDRAMELVPKSAMSQRELESAQADYEVARAKFQEAKLNQLEAMAAVKQAEADVQKTRADLGAEGELNPRLRLSRAKVREAELDLEFTRVRAPVDGYVTNLNLRLGSHAVTNQAALALVDTDSFWIHGFFRENYLEPIQLGDKAIVTLMSYPDTPLEGRVESLAWGIAQQDGSVGEKLLPNVKPTFEWIRLAQRVPVRIRLFNVPDTVKLRVGTTASVMIIAGSKDSGDTTVTAVPRALQ